MLSRSVLATRLLLIPALVVLLAGCETMQRILPAERQQAPDQSALLVGPLWVADQIAGRPVAAEPRVTLAFYADGRIVGKGGCNTYFGRDRLDGSALQVSALKAGATSSCAAEIAAQEQAYLAALGSAARYEVRPDPAQPGGSLFVIAADESALRFQRDTTATVQLLNYSCDDGAALRVIFDWAGGTASLAANGAPAVKLTKAAAATGFRFEGSGQSLAGQGSDAQWSNAAGAAPVACRVVG